MYGRPTLLHVDVIAALLSFHPAEMLWNNMPNKPITNLQFSTMRFTHGPRPQVQIVTVGHLTGKVE